MYKQIYHTNTVWPRNKVFTDQKQIKIFKSPQHIEENLFQGRDGNIVDDYFEPEWISQDYVVEFEIFLQRISQFFGERYIDSEGHTISFKEWFSKKHKK